MIIYQLKIVNFKSYNGEHVLGPFDPHFNCVIGPNGNGKSNIIDAVLFVFGFKSSKLRQDSLGSLIHRSAFAQPQKAWVQVIFREGVELLSVSRSITKSGSTYYKFNGEKIGWNELREKLISKKIDLNKNLFIILQGEVERLCELSPQTMVDYLEYISGSDELKEPIEATERLYIEVSIKREEAKMGLSIKRKIFEVIEEKARDMVGRVFIRWRISMLQHLVLKKQILNNVIKIGSLKAEEGQKRQMIEQIEGDVKRIDEQIAVKRKEMHPLDQKVRKNEKQIVGLECQHEKVALKLKQVQRDIQFLMNDKEKKGKEKACFESEKKELGEMSEHQRQFMQKLRKIKYELDSQRHIAKLQLCCQLQGKLSKMKCQQQRLSNKNLQESTNLIINRQKLNIFASLAQSNKEVKQQIKANLKRIQSDKRQLDLKYSQVCQSVQELQRQLKSKGSQKAVSLSHKQKIINEIRSANKLQILCPGTVLMTLRELVVLNPVYQEVIETMLPHLDYFIVDNYEQAKAIADYLKKKQIGRMTFLIKELINQAVKDINVDGNCPPQTKLIVDLIKCTDSDVKNILIWALGSTLVTNELQIAMKVAYYDQRKYRVITTKGQFIDSSGTMTKLSLKSTGGNEDQQFLQKKLQTLRRLKVALQQKKGGLLQNERQCQQRLKALVEEERCFDGLDEVILDQLQRQIGKDKILIGKNAVQIDLLSEQLGRVKNQLQRGNFSMSIYDVRLEMLRQLAENEEKVRKIENCAQIVKNLERKINKINGEISTLQMSLQAKMKIKIALETQIIKIEREIEDKRSIIFGENQSKSDISKEIRSLEEEKDEKIQKLGDQNIRNGKGLKLRGELSRIKELIKAIEYEQVQLKNRLERSIVALKDMTWSIYGCIYKKYSELIPAKDGKKSESTVVIEKIEKIFIDQSPLQLGKKEMNFLVLLSEAQKLVLFSDSGRHKSIYKSFQAIEPDPEGSLILEAVEIGDLKLSSTYQSQKLKLYLRERAVLSEESGCIDENVLSQYKQNKDDYEGLLRAFTSIESEVNYKKEELIGLRNRRLSIFMKHFNQINVELNRIYTKLTGGKAELNFIDSMNPFEGVEFSVRPVNKSWKRVNLLSGGEKTFTSLALIFACEQIKAFPFYFMDEIDAALDYKNTTLLAHFIKEKTRTQHIVISLRKNMYQECNRIVGIYKVNDQSRTIEMSMAELRRQGDGE